MANTPLGPAIDAGATDIVVVIMTPWDRNDEVAIDAPKNLFEAASTTLEWALLASFQADLKLFRHVNELVRLRLENARLKAENMLLKSQIEGRDMSHLEDKDGDGVPDILQKKFQTLPDPVIIAPKIPIPVEQIIQYQLEKHEKMHHMGYEDARRAWRESGRIVEGE